MWDQWGTVGGFVQELSTNGLEGAGRVSTKLERLC